MSNRIWVTPFDFKADGGTYCDAESRPLAPNKDAKLFVSADLFHSLVEELETCKKYRDAYKECDSIATQKVRELEAERDRLRGALSNISVMGYGYDLVVSARIGEIAVDNARAALKGVE
jgi:hypothetical protein